MKIGVIGQVKASAMARLNAIEGASVMQCPDGSADEIAPTVAGAGAILLRTSVLTPALLDTAPDLQVVSRHGVGFDNLPYDYLSGRGIPIAISASANKISVAEHVFAFMLAVAKNVATADQVVRQGEWAARNRLNCTEIFGRKLLIAGFGRIGREVAQRALAFGMQVFVYDPYIGDDPIEALGCNRAALLSDAVGEVDMITLHLPLSDETRGMFGAQLLARVKPGAVLINTARGGIVDEVALAAALKDGRISAAGIDVMSDEPPLPGHPLFDCDNVYLSPHIAGVTSQSLERMGLEAAANIASILEGRPDPSVIVNWDDLQASA